MRIIQKGIYKGRKFEVGKMVHSEEDILNTEKSFATALKTLNVIRKEAELILYGKDSSLEKNIYGKRKAS